MVVSVVWLLLLLASVGGGGSRRRRRRRRHGRSWPKYYGMVMSTTPTTTPRSRGTNNVYAYVSTLTFNFVSRETVINIM
jgi:hypothetical protein